MPAATQLSFRTLRPLQSPTFRRLWIGLTISLIGDQFYLVALPWLVLQITGSAVIMSTILMTAAVPRAALMLVGGTVSDLISPRRILITTALTRGLLVAGVGTLIVTHSLHRWELFALSFCFGIADAFASPAIQTYLPYLVTTDHLLDANSLVQTTIQLIIISCPAAAAIIIKTFGLASAFLVDGASFFVMFAILCPLPDMKALHKPDNNTTVWSSVIEILRHLKTDTPLRLVVVLAIVFNFCLSGPITVGLPYLASTKFGSAASYVMLLSAWGLGGIAGKIASPLLKVRLTYRLLLAVGLFMALSLALLGIVPTLLALGGVLAVMGFASGLVNLHILSWCQLRTDQILRGRVMSLLILASVGTFPFSLALAGVLAQWNITFMFAFTGALMFLVTICLAREKIVFETA